MKNHIAKFTVSIVVSLLVCGNVMSQSFANNLAAASVDPISDSIAISIMRARLDSIRNTENRPTVAVVFSGGGAKGASYIGILRYMEELGIPIDLICGTSMGGLVGGLRALGYNSNELETIFTSVDWNEVMSDDIAMKFIPFEQKKYKSEFGLSLPFYYDDLTHEKRNQILKQPFAEGDLESSASRKKVLSTLPMGYINGFNIEAILSNLSVGYHDDTTFDRLPIPFYCVSSDLVSAKANYHTEGSIVQAMRATMSIPGVFSPVRMQSRILVDGGTRNNFPVDIAKSMGADIIIGAEAAKRGTTYSDVNSALDILSCMITMLGDDARSSKQAQPDMFIKPETGNLKTLSFNAEAISELIAAGYESAKSHEEDFRKIKEQLGDYVMPDQSSAPKATNLFQQKVRVGGIMVNGIERDEQKMFRKILDFKGYREVSHQEIKDAMCRVMATGAFEKVDYSLKENPSTGEYTLVFDCIPGQIHNLGISLRMDTEEMAKLMLNLRLNAHKLRGWQFDITGKVSSQQSVSLRASYIPNQFAQINFVATESRVRADVMTPLDNIKFDLAMINSTQELYLSSIHRISHDIRIGLRHEYLSIPDEWPMFSIVDESTSGMILNDFTRKGHFLTGFARVDVNTMNDRQFPTRGFVGRFGFEYDFKDFSHPETQPVVMLDLNAKLAIPICRWLTVTPDFNYRGYFGDSVEEGKLYSFFHSNYLGGAIKGRYVRHQIPFVGFGDVTHVKNQVSVLNMEARFQLAKKLYVSGLLGMVTEDDTFHSMISDMAPDFWGYGLEFGYRTVAGPIKLNFHKSNSKYCSKFQCYFSIGFDF